MRNIIIKTGVAAVLASMLVGCTGNYLAINTNPYEVSKEQTLTDGYAIGAAITALCGTIVSTEIGRAHV